MWVEIDVSTRPCSDSFFFAFSSFLLSLKNNILKLQFGLERSKENRIDSDVLTCKAGVFCSVNDDTTSPNFLLISTSKKSRCTDEVCKLLLPSSATIKTCDVSCCQWSQSTNSQRLPVFGLRPRGLFFLKTYIFCLIKQIALMKFLS